VIQTPAEFATYLGYSAGWHAVRRMPERAAYALFASLADQLWRQRGSGVQQLERNLARVESEATQRQLRELSRAGMQSYFRYWCEVFRLPDWSRNDIVDSVFFERHELVQSMVDQGKGAVFALPHSGNYDLVGAYGTLRYRTVVSVAENLKPQRLTAKFLSYREQLGMEIITLRPGEDIFGQLVDKLHEGKIIALLGDRDLTSSGVPVEFFGEPTRMPAGPAALALETGAPLVVAGISYRADGVHVSISDPVQISTAADKTTAVRQTTQAIAAGFETAITANPHDWHMLQRLWLADLDPSRLQESRYA